MTLRPHVAIVLCIAQSRITSLLAVHDPTSWPTSNAETDRVRLHLQHSSLSFVPS